MPGLKLKHVQGQPVAGLTFKEALELVKTAPRPVRSPPHMCANQRLDRFEIRSRVAVLCPGDATLCRDGAAARRRALRLPGPDVSLIVAFSMPSSAAPSLFASIGVTCAVVD